MHPTKVEPPIAVATIICHNSRTSRPVTWLIPSFQERVTPWMDECFGPRISADTSERNHRFIEEALELVQAGGMDRSEAHQLVDYVYDRPKGELKQEVGGVMVTLAALCLAQGVDMHDCGETELARVWTKVEAIRAKQAAKPKHSPLPARIPFREAVENMVIMLEEREWAEHVSTFKAPGDPLAARLESAITDLHNEARREGSRAADYLRRALDWIDAIPSDVVSTLPAMPGFNRDEAEQAIEAESDSGSKFRHNLEGVADALLAPRVMKRNEDGALYHPDFPIFDEGVRADLFLTALGLESAFVSMEQDAPHLWNDENEYDLNAWTPTPPASDWVLLEVYDTENGPYAMFARQAKPEKASA